MKKSFLDIVEEALVNVDEVDCIQLKHAKDNEEDFIQLIIYCQSGFRSVLACESIKRMGYNQVSSLKGGISEWQSSGFPIED